jgi:hypothetical protein
MKTYDYVEVYLCVSVTYLMEVLAEPQAAAVLLLSKGPLDLGSPNYGSRAGHARYPARHSLF